MQIGNRSQDQEAIVGIQGLDKELVWEFTSIVAAKVLKLLNTEEFLDSIIESIPVMIFVKEAKELRFVRFNKAADELLGFSKDEMIGKNDYDFFPKEQADFFTTKDREVLDSRKVLDIAEEEIQTKNLGKRILHTRKIGLYGENGEPMYLLGISEDITDQTRSAKELIAKNQELENLNKAMIDRELKMVELKKEIADLEAKLGKSA